MKHTYSEYSENSQKSWLEVIEEYENKITNLNNKSVHAPPLLLSLKRIKKNLNTIAGKSFQDRIRSITYPIIFMNSEDKKKNTLIIKYTGEENYFPIIQDIIQHQLVHQKAIVISPNHLSKSKREKENLLVKQVASYFNPTFFIKLPLTNLNDYLQFAGNEHSALLLLPFKDLEKYIDVLKKLDYHQPIIPAVFQPYR